MDTWVFYLIAFIMVALGAFLIMNTSPYTRYGGIKYERRRRRRDLAVLLWVLAAILLGLGVVTHFASGNL